MCSASAKVYAPLKCKFAINAVHEAGCDEAGRGCLAGPVFAAAVILPDVIPEFIKQNLNDSKKKNAHQREQLRQAIEQHAFEWAVALVEPDTIDKVNILNASILAMHGALERLPSKPDFIIVDGNKFAKFYDIDHECIVGGDGKFLSIAAASILAKTYRDKYMNELHVQFPQYCWDKNKGYPTKAHLSSLAQLGPCLHHRRSFAPVRQTRLQF